MIRLEGSHLFVEGNGDELGDLDPDYALGTEFTVRIAVENGTIDIYYDDLATPAVSVQRDADGCYFKAGAYTQSNLEYDAADAYGAVAIVGCDRNQLPLRTVASRIRDTADREEFVEQERHLLYVACTRARERLLVSWSGEGCQWLEPTPVPAAPARSAR